MYIGGCGLERGRGQIGSKVDRPCSTFDYPPWRETEKAERETQSEEVRDWLSIRCSPSVYPVPVRILVASVSVRMRVDGQAV